MSQEESVTVSPLLVGIVALEEISVIPRIGACPACKTWREQALQSHPLVCHKCGLREKYHLSSEQLKAVGGILKQARLYTTGRRDYDARKEL